MLLRLNDSASLHYFYNDHSNPKGARQKSPEIQINRFVTKKQGCVEKVMK